MGLDGDENIERTEGELVVAPWHAALQLPNVTRGGKDPDVDWLWLLQPDEQVVEPAGVNHDCHVTS